MSRLSSLLSCSQYGPQVDPNTFDYTAARTLFANGRCAFTIDYADIPTFVHDSKYDFVRLNTAGTVPGTTKVVNRETDKLVSCTAELCPISGANAVNFCPYSTGGWGMSIAKNEEDTRTLTLICGLTGM